jgi:hypothetical protein
VGSRALPIFQGVTLVASVAALASAHPGPRGAPVSYSRTGAIASGKSSRVGPSLSAFSPLFCPEYKLSLARGAGGRLVLLLGALVQVLPWDSEGVGCYHRTPINLNMNWYDNPITQRVILMAALGIFFSASAIFPKEYFWRGGGPMPVSLGRTFCGVLAVLCFIGAILLKLGVLTVSNTKTPVH